MLSVAESPGEEGEAAVPEGSSAGQNATLAGWQGAHDLGGLSGFWLCSERDVDVSDLKPHTYCECRFRPRLANFTGALLKQYIGLMTAWYQDP